MGIENITARILQEAKDEAKKTQEAAAAQKAAMLEKAAQDAAAAEAKMAEKATEDAKVLLERRNSVAELEARKLRLAAKQEALEETFQEAAEKIAALDGSVYLDFIVKTLEPYREEGGEISLNARDYANLKDSLEKALAGSKLTVGAEQANIAGGFILKQGKVYVNASLEKILETEKKQMTGEVAGILFGGSLKRRNRCGSRFYICLRESPRRGTQSSWKREAWNHDRSQDDGRCAEGAFGSAVWQ